LLIANKERQLKKSGKIRLTGEGVWLHDGVEITHKRTVELFFKSVLYKKGKYFLTGEKVPVPITVDDVAIFVRGIKNRNGHVVLKLSNGLEENLDISSVDVGEGNQLYCLTQNGDVPAKFERKVYYELMKNLKEIDGYYGLEIGGLFYPVQSVKRAKELEAEEKLAKVKKTVKKVAVKKKVVKKKVAKKKPAKKKAVKKKAPKKKPAKKKAGKKSPKKKVIKKKTVKKATKNKTVKKKSVKKKKSSKKK